MRIRTVSVAAFAVACALVPYGTSAAVASPGTAATSATGASASPAAGPSASWPVFNGNTARTGAVTGLPAAGRLSVAWTAKLDGAVYGQPLVISGMIVAATENDSVYALNKANGHIIWRAHLGTPVPQATLVCGNINPLGITGTPAYDQQNGLVYAVAETTGFHHVLFGLSVTNGAVKAKRDIPAPDGQARWDQQRPALAIEGGRVYVAFGGLAGDCGPYRGSVVGVPLSGTGPLVSYVVPTTREGAIWAIGGPVTGPGGTLFVSVGNGAAVSGAFDGSDSVIALTTALRRVGIFAPATWASDNKHDKDLGSTAPALLPGGRLLALGKTGNAYLLNAARLGGVGGQIASLHVCAAWGAASVSGTTVYEPCRTGGTAAVSVTGGAHLRVLWHGPAATPGSPVAGGGAVWVTGPGSGKGRLYELNPATGKARTSIALSGGLPSMSSLSLSGNDAFIGTLAGVTAVRGV